MTLLNAVIDLVSFSGILFSVRAPPPPPPPGSRSMHGHISAVIDLSLSRASCPQCAPVSPSPFHRASGGLCINLTPGRHATCCASSKSLCLQQSCAVCLSVERVAAWHRTFRHIACHMLLERLRKVCGSRLTSGD